MLVSVFIEQWACPYNGFSYKEYAVINISISEEKRAVYNIVKSLKIMNYLYYVHKFI